MLWRGVAWRENQECAVSIKAARDSRLRRLEATSVLFSRGATELSASKVPVFFDSATCSSAFDRRRRASAAALRASRLTVSTGGVTSSHSVGDTPCSSSRSFRIQTHSLEPMAITMTAYMRMLTPRFLLFSSFFLLCLAPFLLRLLPLPVLGSVACPEVVVAA